MFLRMLIAALLIIATAAQSQAPLQLIMLKMNSRTVNKGKFTQMQADICYQSRDGKMTASYSEPAKMIVITNNKGEAVVYDPVRNAVGLKQSEAYSTQGSYFYYFLANKVHDMGLGSLGFTLSETKFNNERMITTWLPSQSTAAVISKVELVTKNYKPEFMAYYNEKGKPMRKVYYYDYAALANNQMIPLTVTEINYFEEDSAVTKTKYSDIKINNQVTDLSLINFTIPSDARKIGD